MPSSEPNIPQYQMGKDYWELFFTLWKTWRWPATEWACKLIPLLSGKALDAYTAVDEEQAHSYTGLKAALLIKCDISPDTYWQQFCSSSIPIAETPTDTCHRFKRLYCLWIRPEWQSNEEIASSHPSSTGGNLGWGTWANWRIDSCQVGPPVSCSQRRSHFTAVDVNLHSSLRTPES